MSATAVCGWGAVAVAAAGPSRNWDGKEQVGGRTLVPVVGVVNGVSALPIRSTRWQQRLEPSRANRRWQAPNSQLRAQSVGDTNFEEEVLKSKIPVLVDFCAPWCGPCKLMGGIMDWAAQEFEGKVKCVKIETDPNPVLTEKYKVYGLPTLILFVDGKEVPGSRKEGALNKEKLSKYLEQVVPSPATT